MLDSKASTPQPPPTAGRVDVAPIVIADIEARVAAGKQKYGVLLQTHNGRNALWDLYQELIDACMYVRQRLLEEEEEQQTPTPITLTTESRRGNHVYADRVTAYSCWLTKDGKFDASQTYVHADLPMRPDLAVAELRRGRVVVIGVGDLDYVRGRIEDSN